MSCSLYFDIALLFPAALCVFGLFFLVLLCMWLPELLCGFLLTCQLQGVLSLWLAAS